MAGIQPVKPVNKPGSSTSGKPNQGNGKSNTKKQPTKQPNSIWDVARKNIQGWANNEVQQFKEHPFLKTGAYLSGAAGFIPGAAGTAASGAEAYLNTKVNGGTDFEARRNAALTSAATLGMGKLANVGGKALAKTKVGQTVANKAGQALEEFKAGVDNLINPPKLATQSVYHTPNSVMAKSMKEVANSPVKGQGTSHNIIAPVLKEQPGRFPTITKRDMNTGRDATYKLDSKTGKYIKDKEMSPQEMFDYREKELAKKLEANGYDMNKGGIFVDENGRLTDESWLTPEAETHMPYLYDTDTYLHIAPNKIAKGDSFNPELRANQEAFWTDRGGDLGEGAYGTRLDSLARTNYETNEPVYNYNLNTYNRMHPLAYENYFEAPSKKYLYEGELSLDQQSNPNMRWLLNKAMEHRNIPGGTDDLRIFSQTGDALENNFSPMNVNTLLDRRYGIPGNEGWGQTAIGGEDLNTFITDNRRVAVPERVNQMVETNYLDPQTGMIYNGITKKPQIAYPGNKPLIMDNEEKDILKKFGIRPISDMYTSNKALSN